MEAPRATRQFARGLRRRLTPPEAKLWAALRSEAMQVWKFRRQHPIGSYVLDFYCHRLRLAVEVDGQDHEFGDGPTRDARRDTWMAVRGIRTLRVPALEVRDNPDGVIATILAVARGEA